MERVSFTLAAVLVLGLGAGGVAEAQSLNTYNINNSDAPEKEVPGFYPALEMDLVYDDNIQRSENNKIDSMIMEIRPELQWIAALGKHRLRLGYQGYYGLFQAASSENFDDHYLGADVALDLTPKLNLGFTTDFRREHEARSVAIGPIGTSPNRWEQWAVASEVVYGRRIAKAQVALKAVHRDREYLNNNQDFRNYQADEFTATFFYNLGPKTQLLVEPSITQFNYTTTGATQDNDLKRILVGVTWDATAKTTGSFKIGQHDKRFDNGIGDTNGLSVEAEVVWKPKTYSTVTAALSRNAYDSALGGGSQSFEAVLAKLNWVHELTRLVELDTGISYEQDDYDVGRQDDLIDAHIGLSYAVKRSLTVGVRYDFQRRDSSVAGAGFDDNRIAIGFKAVSR